MFNFIVFLKQMYNYFLKVISLSFQKIFSKKKLLKNIENIYQNLFFSAKNLQLQTSSNSQK